jgi:D-alanyl-D-alanine dipeptidase
MDDIVLMSDPAVTSIPVHENGEPLRDLREYSGFVLDSRLADADGAYAQLRAGVTERLVAAQALLPGGLLFLVVEGYRPLSLQVAYFERHVRDLRQAHPQWSDAVVHREASRSLSPPEIGPHVCGAAVDLTLCTASGAELPMGGEVNADSEAGGACYTAAAGLAPRAVRNRRILVETLTGAGLVNYPTEWWHWSYGDRYWAQATGAPAAHYGQLHNPDFSPRQPQAAAGSCRRAETGAGSTGGRLETEAIPKESHTSGTEPDGGPPPRGR